jgi:hypothetical protein
MKRQSNEMNVKLQDKYDRELSKIVSRLNVEADSNHRTDILSSPILRSNGNSPLKASPTKTSIHGSDASPTKKPSTGNYRSHKSNSNEDESRAKVNSGTKISTELTEERDRQLQFQIRQFQIESVKLERQWRAKSDEDRKRIIEAKEKEEAEYRRKQKQLTEELSGLALEREALVNQVKKF